MKHRALFFSLASLMLGFSWPVLGQENANRDLMQLVGSDAGLCVEITNLKRRIPRLAESALVNRLKKLPVYTAWKASPEFHKLANFQKVVEAKTGQPLEEFALGLFGHSVVFAVYPDRAEEPKGVLLLRAADEKTLQSALSAWNHNERLQLETLSFSKGQYFKRTEPRRKNAKLNPRSQFYFVDREILALSDNETLIQEILTRRLNPSEHTPLPKNPHYQTAQTSLPKDCWVTAYFQPKAWKTGWDLGEESTPAERHIAQLWKRCEVIAAGMRADRGFSLDLIVHYDPSELPARVQQFINRTSGFPDFLNHVPQGAMLVIAGKQDLAGIDQLLTAQMDPAAKQQWQTARQITRGFLLGLDLFEDVLPKLPPNWGLYLLPRKGEVSNADETAFPVEALFAIELPAPPDDKGVITVRKALGNGLSTGFHVLAAMQNPKSPGKPVQLKSQALFPGNDQSDLQVHYLDAFGAYRPAYCLSDEFLFFASSPRMIVDFHAVNQPKLSQTAAFKLWTEREGAPQGQVLFISWQAVREFLSKHQDFLLKQAVESHGLTREESQTRLKKLEDVLTILDAVYFGLQIRPDQIRLSTSGLTVE